MSYDKYAVGLVAHNMYKYMETKYVNMRMKYAGNKKVRDNCRLRALHTKSP